MEELVCYGIGVCYGGNDMVGRIFVFIVYIIKGKVVWEVLLFLGLIMFKVFEQIYFWCYGNYNYWLFSVNSVL